VSGAGQRNFSDDFFLTCIWVKEFCPLKWAISSRPSSKSELLPSKSCGLLSESSSAKNSQMQSVPSALKTTINHKVVIPVYTKIQMSRLSSSRKPFCLLSRVKCRLRRRKLLWILAKSDSHCRFQFTTLGNSQHHWDEAHKIGNGTAKKSLPLLWIEKQLNKWMLCRIFFSHLGR
jgi:hypothetical protein